MKDAVRQLLIGTSTFLVMIILLLVGTKYDYQIAEAMYAPGNLLSVIMNALSKMPAFFLMGASCAILVKCTNNKDCNIVIKRTFFVIYTLLGVVSASFGFLDTFQIIFKDEIIYQYILSLLCGIVIYTLFMITICKYRDLEFERYKKWAFTTCITVGLIAIITYAMKFLFGRLSFDDISNGLGDFCVWYKIQNAGGWAMPDNKTALACAIFMIMPLTKIHSKLTNKSFWFILLSLLFVVLVMLGGLFGGTYYLSDVAVGAIIGIIITKASTNIAFGSDGTKIELSERNILNKL